jgi:WD40 repeat protein/energy-coupling factor transporter ATP-binding protein EcfA2
MSEATSNLYQEKNSPSPRRPYRDPPPRRVEEPERVPYPGLRPFEEWESHRFFGRESQVDELLLRLERGRFVAVVGVSGSGKSSLVRAGLVPALHAGRLPTLQRGWRVATLRPGNQPIRNLAEALAEAHISTSPAPDYPIPTATLADVALRQSGRALVDVAGSTLAAEGADAFNALVFVDQFEEIFRYRREGSPEAKHFVQLLIEAARQNIVPLYIVLTMRADFLGECAFFRGLLELINDGQYVVQRMTRTEQRAAIEKPAQTLGVTIRPRLVNRLLNDLGDDPDRLPVLQHAVRRAWMHAHPDGAPLRDLDLKDYEEVGTMQDAIGNQADDVYAHLTERQRLLAEKMFRALTDGTTNPRGERRPLLLSRLAAVIGVESAELVKVINVFRTPDRCFLTPPARESLDETKDTIDLSHESLMWLWPKLRDKWMPAEAADARILRQLAEWKRTDGLLPEGLVQRAEEWRDGSEGLKPTAAWAELYLREASDDPKTGEDRKSGEDRKTVEEKFAACLKLIDDSREDLRARRAVEMKREQKIRWLKWTVLFACLAAGLGSGNWFYQTQQKKVVGQSNATAAGAVVESATSALNEAEQQVSKLIAAIDAAATEAPPEKTAVEQVRRAKKLADAAEVTIGILAKSIREAANTSGDKQLTELADSLDGQARHAGERIATLQKPSGAEGAAAKALKERLAQAEYRLNGLIGWKGIDLATVKSRANDISAATAQLNAIDAISAAALVVGFDISTDAELSKRITDVKTTLNATYVVQSSEIKPGTIMSWTTDKAFRLEFGDKINRVRFSPKSSPDTPLLAIACEDNKVYFWRKGGTPRGIPAATHGINDIDFSPLGGALAAASNGSTVRILRWASSVAPETGNAAITNSEFQKHSDSITDVEYSRGGDYVVSSSADRTVRVFEPDKGMSQHYFTSPPLPGIVTSATFHRGGNLVVSGCDDGGVRLHTLAQPAVQLLGKFDAPARRPEFSEDGKFVLAASGDKTARVWPIVAPRELVRITHEAPVTQATFRPITNADRYDFVTTATNGEVRFVPLTEQEMGKSPVKSSVLEPRHPGAAVSARWSADGNWLATVGGGEVILWNWLNGAPVARLRMVNLNRATSRAEFSPDAHLLVTYGGDQFAYVWDLTEPLAAP